MNDSKIAAAVESLVTRAFQRETLVTIAAMYLIYSGRVTTMEEALATVATVTTLIAGRSWVKATKVTQ